MEPASPNRVEAVSSEWLTPGRFAGLLGLLMFVAFPRVMLGLDSFYYRDYGVLGYPFVFHHHQSFWRGELPLWNPLSNCGAPFLAQWGTMVLYPFSLIYLIFPLPWSLSYFCLGHIFLGGLGMYFLARRWTESEFPAGIAGLSYVFNGITLSCLVWPNYSVALGWMPWVVLCVQRSWQEGGRRIVLAALVSALQMLSGVPEVVLLTWVLLGTLWIHELLEQKGSRRVLAVRFLTVVIIVAGLTAIQLLPFWDLLGHSQRDRAFVTSKWAMPTWGLANLLVPLFHSFETFQGPFFIYGQEFLSSYYLGIALLICAVWGAFHVRTARFWILASLAAFSLVMAMGENGVLFPWLKRMIPMIGIARFPIKFVVLAGFTFPLLAAYALGGFEQAPRVPRFRRSLFAVSFLALLGMAIILWVARHHPFAMDQWPVTLKSGLTRGVLLLLAVAAVCGSATTVREPWRRFAQASLLVLITVDVLTHTPKQNPTLAVSAFDEPLWAQHDSTIPPRYGEARAMISQEAEQHLLRSRVGDAMSDFMGKRLALWSNLNLLETIPKVNGSSTLQLREEKQVEKLLYGDTPRIGTGLVDFLAVSHVTKPGTIIEWSTRSNFCPMITSGQKPVFANPEATLELLASATFDPRQEVYLPPESKGVAAMIGQSRATILRQRFRSHRIEFEVEAEKPAMVVIAQSFYHPWKATMGGKGLPLLRANHAFQALVVPKGRHEVLLVYDDRNFFWGVVISALTSLGCLLYWYRLRKRSSGAA